MSAPSAVPGPIPHHGVGSLKADLGAFASRNRNMAAEILGAQTGARHTGPTVIHYYHDYNTPWWSRCYTPILFMPDYGYRGCCYGGHSRRGDDGNFFIGFLAAVVSAVAIVAVGSGISALEDSTRELEDARDQQRKFQKHAAQPNAPQEQEKIQHAIYAAGLKERICQRIKRSALSDLIMRIGVLAGATFALFGAIFAHPAMITAGVITGLVFGGAMLFKYGLGSDKQNFRDAAELKQISEQLAK